MQERVLKKANRLLLPQAPVQPPNERKLKRKSAQLTLPEQKQRNSSGGRNKENTQVPEWTKPREKYYDKAEIQRFIKKRKQQQQTNVPQTSKQMQKREEKRQYDSGSIREYIKNKETEMQLKQRREQLEAERKQETMRLRLKELDEFRRKQRALMKEHRKSRTPPAAPVRVSVERPLDISEAIVEKETPISAVETPIVIPERPISPNVQPNVSKQPTTSNPKLDNALMEAMDLNERLNRLLRMSDAELREVVNPPKESAVDVSVVEPVIEKGEEIVAVDEDEVVEPVKLELSRELVAKNLQKSAEKMVLERDGFEFLSLVGKKLIPDVHEVLREEAETYIAEEPSIEVTLPERSLIVNEQQPMKDVIPTRSETVIYVDEPQDIPLKPNFSVLMKQDVCTSTTDLAIIAELPPSKKNVELQTEEASNSETSEVEPISAQAPLVVNNELEVIKLKLDELNKLITKNTRQRKTEKQKKFKQLGEDIEVRQLKKTTMEERIKVDLSRIQRILDESSISSDESLIPREEVSVESTDVSGVIPRVDLSETETTISEQLSVSLSTEEPSVSIDMSKESLDLALEQRHSASAALVDKIRSLQERLEQSKTKYSRLERDLKRKTLHMNEQFQQKEDSIRVEIERIQSEDSYDETSASFEESVAKEPEGNRSVEYDVSISDEKIIELEKQAESNLNEEAKEELVPEADIPEENKELQQVQVKPPLKKSNNEQHDERPVVQPLEEPKLVEADLPPIETELEVQVVPEEIPLSELKKETPLPPSVERLKQLHVHREPPPVPALKPHVQPIKLPPPVIAPSPAAKASEPSVAQEKTIKSLAASQDIELFTSLLAAELFHIIYQEALAMVDKRQTPISASAASHELYVPANIVDAVERALKGSKPESLIVKHLIEPKQLRQHEASVFRLMKRRVNQPNILDLVSKWDKVQGDVDQMLNYDVTEEEKDWTDFDYQEAVILETVTDMIFEDLLQATALSFDQ